MMDARCHLRFRKERETLVACASKAASLNGNEHLFRCPVLSCKRSGKRGQICSFRNAGEEQHSVAVHLLADHHELIKTFAAVLDALEDHCNRTSSCPFDPSHKAHEAGWLHHLHTCHAQDAWALAVKLDREFGYSGMPTTLLSPQPADSSRGLRKRSGARPFDALTYTAAPPVYINARSGPARRTSSAAAFGSFTQGTFTRRPGNLRSDLLLSSGRGGAVPGVASAGVSSRGRPSLDFDLDPLLASVRIRSDLGLTGAKPAAAAPRELLYPCPFGCGAQLMQGWGVAAHVLERHLGEMLGLKQQQGTPPGGAAAVLGHPSLDRKGNNERMRSPAKPVRQEGHSPGVQRGSHPRAPQGGSGSDPGTQQGDQQPPMLQDEASTGSTHSSGSTGGRTGSKLTLGMHTHTGDALAGDAGSAGTHSSGSSGDEDEGLVNAAGPGCSLQGHTQWVPSGMNERQQQQQRQTEQCHQPKAPWLGMRSGPEQLLGYRPGWDTGSAGGEGQITNRTSFSHNNEMAQLRDALSSMHASLAGLECKARQTLSTQDLQALLHSLQPQDSGPPAGRGDPTSGKSIASTKPPVKLKLEQQQQQQQHTPVSVDQSQQQQQSLQQQQQQQNLPPAGLLMSQLQGVVAELTGLVLEQAMGAAVLHPSVQRVAALAAQHQGLLCANAKAQHREEVKEEQQGDVPCQVPLSASQEQQQQQQQWQQQGWGARPAYQQPQASEGTSWHAPPPPPPPPPQQQQQGHRHAADSMIAALEQRLMRLEQQAASSAPVSTPRRTTPKQECLNRRQGRHRLRARTSSATHSQRSSPLCARTAPPRGWEHEEQEDVGDGGVSDVGGEHSWQAPDISHAQQWLEGERLTFSPARASAQASRSHPGRASYDEPYAGTQGRWGSPPMYSHTGLGSPPISSHPAAAVGAAGLSLTSSTSSTSSEELEGPGYSSAWAPLGGHNAPPGDHSASLGGHGAALGTHSPPGGNHSAPLVEDVAPCGSQAAPWPFDAASASSPAVQAAATAAATARAYHALAELADVRSSHERSSPPQNAHAQLQLARGQHSYWEGSGRTKSQQQQQQQQQQQAALYTAQPTWGLGRAAAAVTANASPPPAPGKQIGRVRGGAEHHPEESGRGGTEQREVRCQAEDGVQVGAGLGAHLNPPWQSQAEGSKKLGEHCVQTEDSRNSSPYQQQQQQEQQEHRGCKRGTDEGERQGKASRGSTPKIHRASRDLRSRFERYMWADGKDKEGEEEDEEEEESYVCDEHGNSSCNSPQSTQSRRRFTAFKLKQQRLQQGRTDGFLWPRSPSDSAETTTTSTTTSSSAGSTASAHKQDAQHTPMSILRPTPASPLSALAAPQTSMVSSPAAQPRSPARRRMQELDPAEVMTPQAVPSPALSETLACPPRPGSIHSAPASASVSPAPALPLAPPPLAMTLSEASILPPPSSPPSLPPPVASALPLPPAPTPAFAESAPALPPPPSPPSSSPPVSPMPALDPPLVPVLATAAPTAPAPSSPPAPAAAAPALHPPLVPALATAAPATPAPSSQSAPAAAVPALHPPLAPVLATAAPATPLSPSPPAPAAAALASPAPSSSPAPDNAVPPLPLPPTASATATTEQEQQAPDNAVPPLPLPPTASATAAKEQVQQAPGKVVPPLPLPTTASTKATTEQEQQQQQQQQQHDPATGGQAVTGMQQQQQQQPPSASMPRSTTAAAAPQQPMAHSAAAAAAAAAAGATQPSPSPAVPPQETAANAEESVASGTVSSLTEQQPVSRVQGRMEGAISEPSSPSSSSSSSSSSSPYSSLASSVSVMARPFKQLSQNRGTQAFGVQQGEQRTQQQQQQQQQEQEQEQLKHEHQRAQQQQQQQQQVQHEEQREQEKLVRGDSLHHVQQQQEKEQKQAQHLQQNNDEQQQLAQQDQQQQQQQPQQKQGEDETQQQRKQGQNVVQQQQQQQKQGEDETQQQRKQRQDVVQQQQQQPAQLDPQQQLTQERQLRQQQSLLRQQQQAQEWKQQQQAAWLRQREQRQQQEKEAQEAEQRQALEQQQRVQQQQQQQGQQAQSVRDADVEARRQEEDAQKDRVQQQQQQQQQQEQQAQSAREAEVEARREEEDAQKNRVQQQQQQQQHALGAQDADVEANKEEEGAQKERQEQQQEEQNDGASPASSDSEFDWGFDFPSSAASRAVPSALAAEPTAPCAAGTSGAASTAAGPSAPSAPAASSSAVVAAASTPAHTPTSPPTCTPTGASGTARTVPAAPASLAGAPAPAPHPSGSRGSLLEPRPSVPSLHDSAPFPSAVHSSQSVPRPSVPSSDSISAPAPHSPDSLGSNLEPRPSVPSDSISAPAPHSPDSLGSNLEPRPSVPSSHDSARCSWDNSTTTEDPRKEGTSAGMTPQAIAAPRQHRKSQQDAAAASPSASELRMPSPVATASRCSWDASSDTEEPLTPMHPPVGPRVPPSVHPSVSASALPEAAQQSSKPQGQTYQTAAATAAGRQQSDSMQHGERGAVAGATAGSSWDEDDDDGGGAAGGGDVGEVASFSDDDDELDDEALASLGLGTPPTKPSLPSKPPPHQVHTSGAGILSMPSLGGDEGWGSPKHLPDDHTTLRAPTAPPSGTPWHSQDLRLRPAPTTGAATSGAGLKAALSKEGDAEGSDADEQGSFSELMLAMGLDEDRPAPSTRPSIRLSDPPTKPTPGHTAHDGSYGQQQQQQRRQGSSSARPSPVTQQRTVHVPRSDIQGADDVLSLLDSPPPGGHAPPPPPSLPPPKQRRVSGEGLGNDEILALSPRQPDTPQALPAWLQHGSRQQPAPQLQQQRQQPHRGKGLDDTVQLFGSSGSDASMEGMGSLGLAAPGASRPRQAPTPKPLQQAGRAAPLTIRPSSALDELDIDLDEVLGPNAASNMPPQRGHSYGSTGQQPRRTPLPTARPSTSHGPPMAPAQSVGGGSRVQGSKAPEDPGAFSLDEEQLDRLML